MIRLENVEKIYPSKVGDITALHDINLQVRPGEIYGVIGRSGAGKSTLIRCVNLLERPTSGKVFVNNQELTSLNEKTLRAARYRIGMVFQHFNLLSTRNVYDNVALPLELSKKSRSFINDVVAPLLKITGLTDRAHAYPAQLSGGQKQRVAIARALTTYPHVLLCDEMTSALDPETTESILDLIKSINKEMNLSILLITHEMEVIKNMADQVAVIDQGRIIEQSDVVSLFKRPQTEVARKFTQSALKAKLPLVMQEHLQSEPPEDGYTLLRIAFIGEAASQPIIDELSKRFEIQFNILQANLEFLHHETIGVMMLSFYGARDEVVRAQKFLQDHQVDVEVLGYVRRDDWAIN